MALLAENRSPSQNREFWYRTGQAWTFQIIPPLSSITIQNVDTASTLALHARYASPFLNLTVV